MSENKEKVEEIEKMEETVETEVIETESRMKRFWEKAKPMVIGGLIGGVTAAAAFLLAVVGPSQFYADEYDDAGYFDEPEPIEVEPTVEEPVTA